MEIQLILEQSECGKSHTTHLQEAISTLYRWVKAEHVQVKVAMGQKDCVLTFHGLGYLSKSQIASIDQWSFAMVCLWKCSIKRFSCHYISLHIELECIKAACKCVLRDLQAALLFGWV